MRRILFLGYYLLSVIKTHLKCKLNRNAILDARVRTLASAVIEAEKEKALDSKFLMELIEAKEYVRTGTMSEETRDCLQRFASLLNMHPYLMWSKKAEACIRMIDKVAPREREGEKC